MNLHIEIHGAEELQGRLTPDTVNQPLGRAIEVAGSVLATPKGDGLGVRRNILDLEVSDMSATVATSLNWPRTAGTRWQERSVQDYEDMAGDLAQTIEGDIVAALGD